MKATVKKGRTTRMKSGKELKRDVTKAAKSTVRKVTRKKK